ncbi:MAG: hypothetical protein HY791_08790 [Deltaproteobacteria bacterium]|nr:hypothetical protein [Deltaproteobacteria bacterium]
MSSKSGLLGLLCQGAVLCLSMSCGAGVPVQLKIDDLTFDLSLDEAVGQLAQSLGAGGILPSAELPEKWPDELPDVCVDFVASTDQVAPAGVDLTPDPEVDPDGASLFAPVNNGTVARIEIDDIVLRVEKNTLTLPLPPVELQAADDKDADPTDRRAWYTIGTIGGSELSRGCAGTPSTAVEPGKVADLDFAWNIGGESFLDHQFKDPDCSDALKCKEFAIRARSRLSLDTARFDRRPRGSVRLRMILVATFFVDPI